MRQTKLFMANERKVASQRSSIVLGLLWLLLFQLGCSQAGIQGGVIAKSFSGIVDIYPISPTAVEIKWELNSRFVKYKIYRREVPESIKEETFGSTVITNLTPLTTYQFSVSGVTEMNEEEGLGDFTPVTTFGNFYPISTTNLAVKSPTRIDLAWTSENKLIRFEIFKRAKEGSFNLKQPDAIVPDGGRAYSFENLTPGTSYCFFVKATYLDGTSEPNDTYATTAPCTNTQTDVTVIPKITMNPVVFGTYPWFLISGAEPTMKTEIFQKNPPPLIDIRLGQITGDGALRSGVAFQQGRYPFYAKVTQFPKDADPRTAIFDLDIMSPSLPNVNQPTGLVRNLNIESDPNKAPLYPNLISQGLGSQALGYAVAKGDFNCDGLPDLAVSGPEATPYLNTAHSQQMGAVIIYYTQSKFNLEQGKYEYTFKTDVAPSTSASAPNPQLVYYPSSSNFRLGLKMTTGNFNNDCLREYYEQAERTPLSTWRANCDAIYVDTNNKTKVGADPQYDVALFSEINRCDDLVITINPTYSTGFGATGGVYVLYGDPASGLVSGAGSINFAVNEEACDTFTGSCRATFHTHWDSANVSQFGRAIGVGDFNNDGYDDLVVSANRKISASVSYGMASVLHGSSSGLQPLKNQANFNFPDIYYSSSNSTGFYTDTSPAPTLPSNEQSTVATYYFGHSVGAAPNARICTTIGTGGSPPPTRPANFSAPYFDFSKCDDLVIGDPGRANGRGAIVSCKGQFDTGAATTDAKKRIRAWDCMGHYPSDIEAGANYGFSLLGVHNQNGYAVATDFLLDGAVPNVTGTLFVGAPYADAPNKTEVDRDPQGRGRDAGKVFAYYITPRFIEANSDSGIRGILQGTASGGEIAHTVVAENEVPCNAENDIVSNERCQNQSLYIPSAQAGMNFGWSLASIDDVREGFDKTRNLPLLAIGAPNRSVPGSAGTTLSRAGALYLFRPDLSVVINDPTKVSCDPAVPKCVCGSNIKLQRGTSDIQNCYSGGINPYGPTIITPSNSVANQNFGLGGAVGDNFNGYQEADVITGAPYNNQSYMAGTTFPKVERHGNVYQFNSGDGGFDPSVTTPDVVGSISTNVSLELNYRYDMAMVVGDVDNDGYDDVITKTLIGTPSRVDLVLYYGSANGLITQPAPSLTPGRQKPTIIQSIPDPILGIKIYRAGDLNGDNFSDVMLVGGDSSYIYYGSSVGLITNSEPSFTPVGKNPLKFAMNKGSNTLYFHMNSSLFSNTNTTYGNDTSGNPPAYAFDINSVSPGDFNGDGYDDLAIGIDDMRTEYYIRTHTDEYPLPEDYSTSYFSASNRGKVIILYGSSKGIQVPPTGAIFIDQPGLKAMNPCTGGKITDPTYSCAIQVISSSASPGAKKFGFSVLAVPPMNATSKEWSLLVSDPEWAVSGSNTNGVVYLYRGSLTGIDIAKNNIRVIRLPADAAPNIGFDKQRFGHTMQSVGDINGDQVDDVAITAPGPYPYPSSSPYNVYNYSSVYILYGQLKASLPSFAGLPLVNGDPITVSSISAMNGRFLSNDVADIKIQRIQPLKLRPTAESAALFGYGVSRLGDFNGDGYADVAMNVARGTYEDTAKITESGFVLIYFGSRRGLMSDTNGGDYSANPKCVGGDGPSGTCETYQLVLPGAKDYENSYINRWSSGDINGDGLTDLLIGGTGRDHPSGKAFSTGVVYVVY